MLWRSGNARGTLPGRPRWCAAGRDHVAEDPAERPQIAEPRDRYTYWPGTQTVPFFAAPRILNRPHAISADVDIPPGGQILRGARARRPGEEMRLAMARQ
jgi:hypothetical protein